MDTYGYQSLFNDLNINETISSDTIFFNKAYGLDAQLMTFYDPVIFQGSITLNGSLILTSDLNMGGHNISNINTVYTNNIRVENLISGNTLTGIIGVDDEIFIQNNNLTVLNGIIFTEELALPLASPQTEIYIANDLNLYNNTISNIDSVFVSNIFNVHSISGYLGNPINLNNDIFVDGIITVNEGQINSGPILFSINGGLGYDVEIYRNNSDLSLTGFLFEDKNISVIGANLILTSGKRLELHNASGTFKTTIKEFDNSLTNKNYILPNVGPVNNDDILTCNIGGVMSWSNLNVNNFNKRIYVMTTDGIDYTNDLNPATLDTGTIIGSKTINGGSLQAGDTFHFSGCGKIKFMNNEELVLSVKYGAYQPFQALLLFSPTLTTHKTFIFDIYITFRTVGVSGTTMAWGSFNCNDATHDYDFNIRLYDGTGIDTTVNRDFSIQGTWTYSDPDNSIQLLSLICHKVY